METEVMNNLSEETQKMPPKKRQLHLGESGTGCCCRQIEGPSRFAGFHTDAPDGGVGFIQGGFFNWPPLKS